MGLPANPHREELRVAIERQAVVLARLDAIKTAQRLELDARGVQRRALADAIGGLAAAATDSEKQTARTVLEKARDDLNEAVKEQRQLEKQYAVRPDAVRRAIVSTASSGSTAFADAFRLRKD